MLLQVPSVEAPSEVLDRGFEILLETHRVHDVPSVQTEPLLGIVCPVGPYDLGKAAVGGELHLVLSDNLEQLAGVFLIQYDPEAFLLKLASRHDGCLASVGTAFDAICGIGVKIAYCHRP